MEIAVELSQIVINEEAEQQVVVLRELAEPKRSFPIVIGMSEVLAIDRRLKGIELPRPLTHDLLAETIKELGGEIQKVVVCDLREHTFFATIYVLQDGKPVEIDSRPSDALALAAGLDVPVFVEERVFDRLEL
ncbi:MAG: bifunctional nuclease family protein [Phycisphaerae bacterium]|nr:bifunctional nuclease family protein [Phycisphaerae bacterium]